MHDTLSEIMKMIFQAVILFQLFMFTINIRTHCKRMISSDQVIHK